jgi:hypothetical protein
MGIDLQFKKGEVLDGWLVALEGVCAGAVVEFIVPAGPFGYQYAERKDMSIHFVVHVMEVSNEKITPPSLFGFVDKNKDGLIDQEEFTKYFVDMFPGQQPPFGLFVKEDLNQDGFLTFDEFTGPKESQPPTLAAQAMERIQKQEVENPDIIKKKKEPIELIKDGPVEFSFGEGKVINKNRNNNNKQHIGNGNTNNGQVLDQDDDNNDNEEEDPHALNEEDLIKIRKIIMEQADSSTKEDFERDEL